MSKLIKTPLRYPGGKSRMAETFVGLMPDFDEYREPFLGGGSVYLTARQLKPGKKYWVNDLYYDLYCFWYEVQRDNPELAREVRETRDFWTTGKYADLGGKCLYEKLVNDIMEYEIDDTQARALAFFIINRITFSGTSMSGGYSQESFDKRFTPSSIDRLEKIGPLLQGTKITCLDYSELLREPGENVFLFLDPPYYTATKSALYGKNGELHKGFDHERFAEEVKNCPHKWMITYDNCEYIREMYKDYNIIPFEFAYGMRNVTANAEMTGKEILITNYEDF
jgi:DNA adenine methylase